MVGLALPLIFWAAEIVFVKRKCCHDECWNWEAEEQTKPEERAEASVLFASCVPDEDADQNIEQKAHHDEKPVEDGGILKGRNRHSKILSRKDYSSRYCTYVARLGCTGGGRSISGP